MKRIVVKIEKRIPVTFADSKEIFASQTVEVLSKLDTVETAFPAIKLSDPSDKIVRIPAGEILHDEETREVPVAESWLQPVYDDNDNVIAYDVNPTAKLQKNKSGWVNAWKQGDVAVVTEAKPEVKASARRK